MKKNLTLTFIFLLSNLILLASKKDSIGILLNIAKTQAVNSQDLRMSIKITSGKTIPVIITKEANLGYLDKKLGVIRVQLQKKIGNKFVDISHGTIDNGPADIDTLYKGGIKTYEFSLWNLYYFRFPKGNYRVRLLNAFSILNPEINDIYSNWTYFSCPQEIRR